MIATDLTQLYQKILLDHSGNPRNFGESKGIEPGHGHNPLCGDEISIYLEMASDRIASIRFTGQACAICTASASLMTEMVSHKDRAAFRSLFEAFIGMLSSDEDEDREDLGDLAIFSGVRKFPTRIKCATLPWYTLESLLENRKVTVTTE
jgi:nitrogen fixation NifU-like protein